MTPLIYMYKDSLLFYSGNKVLEPEKSSQQDILGVQSDQDHWHYWTSVPYTGVSVSGFMGLVSNGDP